MSSQIVEDFSSRQIPHVYIFRAQKQTLAFPPIFFCQTLKSMELHEKTYTDDSSCFV